MIGIYKITNTTNGKCYIGQSRDIKARWAKHLSAYKSSPDWELYRAFKKYGISAFKFEVIEECSLKELNEREIYWIAQYDSYNNGYNNNAGHHDTDDGVEEFKQILKENGLQFIDGNLIAI